MAKLNRNYYDLIVDHQILGKYRLNEKVFVICSNRTNTSEDVNADWLVVNDYRKAIDVIQLFGHLITKIQINAEHMNAAEMGQMTENINANCFSSLVAITLLETKESLNNWSKTFPNVINITISNLRDYNDMELHRVFPNIQYMKLTLPSTYNSSILDHRYKYLKYLEYYEHIVSENSHSAFEDFLRRNPQIRSFITNKPLTKVAFELIRDNLVELETIGITNYPFFSLRNEIDEVIHLKNVKTVIFYAFQTLDGVSNELPLSFDQLESMHLYTFSISDEFLQMIIEQRALKMLAIPWCNIEMNQLLRIVTELGELEKIVVKYISEDETAINDLWDTLRRGEQLRFVDILLGFKVDRDEVIAATPDGWIFIGDGSFEWGPFLSFQRLE